MVSTALLVLILASSARALSVVRDVPHPTSPPCSRWVDCNGSFWAARSQSVSFQRGPGTSQSNRIRGSSLSSGTARCAVFPTVSPECWGWVEIRHKHHERKRKTESNSTDSCFSASSLTKEEFTFDSSWTPVWRLPISSKTSPRTSSTAIPGGDVSSSKIFCGSLKNSLFWGKPCYLKTSSKRWVEMKASTHSVALISPDWCSSTIPSSMKWRPFTVRPKYVPSKTETSATWAWNQVILLWERNATLNGG